MGLEEQGDAEPVAHRPFFPGGPEDAQDTDQQHHHGVDPADHGIVIAEDRGEQDADVGEHREGAVADQQHRSNAHDTDAEQSEAGKGHSKKNAELEDEEPEDWVSFGGTEPEQFRNRGISCKDPCLGFIPPYLMVLQKKELEEQIGENQQELRQGAVSGYASFRYRNCCHDGCLSKSFPDCLFSLAERWVLFLTEERNLLCWFRG